MNRKELDIVFVSSFYDIPLAGLCRYNGKIERFHTDYDTEESTIIFLTPIQRLKALWSKWLFEICVGKHQTYENGKKSNYFYWRKPVIVHKLLYRLYYKMRLTNESD